MRASSIVMQDEFGDDTSQMAFADLDQRVEALAADRANQSFTTSTGSKESPHEHARNYCAPQGTMGWWQLPQDSKPESSAFCGSRMADEPLRLAARGETGCFHAAAEII